MPFDGQTPWDFPQGPSMPRKGTRPFEAEAYLALLRDPSAWPLGFVWDYQKVACCGEGLAWAGFASPFHDLQGSEDVANYTLWLSGQLGIPPLRGEAIFLGLPDLLKLPSAAITPSMVASLVEDTRAGRPVPEAVEAGCIRAPMVIVLDAGQAGLFAGASLNEIRGVVLERATRVPGWMFIEAATANRAGFTMGSVLAVDGEFFLAPPVCVPAPVHVGLLDILGPP